jgi:hypothetical protein
MMGKPVAVCKMGPRCGDRDYIEGRIHPATDAIV